VTPRESLEWLFATQQFGIKLGLENTRRLLKGLGSPEEELAFIHVAGTNGKGSVCAMMDAISRVSGRKTGLYTSPHLVDFRERIRVDGEKIPENALAEILTATRYVCEEWDYSPTFFEASTAAALRYFAEEGCDLVILETGMGGRLDSTNVVLPLASVITPISFDHQQWLGATLPEIAGEKAGIIKHGVPVLSAPQVPEVREVLATAAIKAGASLQFVETALENTPLGLSGAFQKQNAALAVAALRAAGITVSDEMLAAALRDVSWPGRFQIVQQHIVLDGGHNPAAVALLVQNWREHYGEEKASIIFGALADKDSAAMLQLLAPIAREFLLVPVRSQRSADPADLAVHVNVPCRVEASLGEALARVCTSPGLMLITGSLFLVGEAMECLGVEP